MGEEEPTRSGDVMHWIQDLVAEMLGPAGESRMRMRDPGHYDLDSEYYDTPRCSDDGGAVRVSPLLIVDGI